MSINRFTEKFGKGSSWYKKKKKKKTGEKDIFELLDYFYYFRKLRFYCKKYYGKFLWNILRISDLQLNDVNLLSFLRIVGRS